MHKEPLEREELIREAWAQEEHYWRLIQQGDDRVLALYDEDVIAWPFSYAVAGGVDLARSYIKEWLEANEMLAYTLTDKVATVSGNDTVALLFYWSAIVVVKDPPPETASTTASTSRVNHTWVKKGDDWTIMVASTAPMS